MPEGGSFKVAALCGGYNANEPLPVSDGTGGGVYKFTGVHLCASAFCSVKLRDVLLRPRPSV